MSILIKNAVIVHQDHPDHLKRKDLLIAKGKIANIGDQLNDAKAKVISSPNLHVSIGWMDIGTHLGEPGYEHRETTDSLCDAATLGGYTALAPFPATKPIIQSASNVLFLKNIFSNKIQDIYPIAALTVDRKGQDLTEMMDLVQNGAVGFGDGMKGLASAGQLMRSMLYLKGKNALVIDFPYDESLAHDGQMHEGTTSVMMGLAGTADMVESIPVKRDIELAEYCKTPLLIHGISSRESVLAIENARKQTHLIFSSVPYLNLIFEDTALLGFDVNLKVLPPIREKSDRKALIKALRNGNIDAIISNHTPLEEELKHLEFPYASYGAIGLETCYAGINTELGPEKTLDLIPRLSIGPRKIFSIPYPEIKVGEKAELTLFDPEIEWTYDSPASISKNSPFLHKKLTGKVVGVINGSKSYFSTID